MLADEFLDHSLVEVEVCLQQPLLSQMLRLHVTNYPFNFTAPHFLTLNCQVLLLHHSHLAHVKQRTHAETCFQISAHIWGLQFRFFWLQLLLKITFDCI